MSWSGNLGVKEAVWLFYTTFARLKIMWGRRKLLPLVWHKAQNLFHAKWCAINNIAANSRCVRRWWLNSLPCPLITKKAGVLFFFKLLLLLIHIMQGMGHTPSALSCCWHSDAWWALGSYKPLYRRTHEISYAELCPLKGPASHPLPHRMESVSLVGNW